MDAFKIINIGKKAIFKATRTENKNQKVGCIIAHLPQMGFGSPNQ